VTHTSSCANAATPECRCSGCAGSMHGWPGRLGLAQISKAPERLHLRHVAERAWADATRPGARKRPTLRKARAAITGAMSSVIDWLAGQIASPPASIPATTEQIAEAVGQLLSGDVVRALDQSLSAAERHAERIALADHFFCALLAELAHAIQQFGKEFDQAAEKIASAIIEARAAQGRSPLPDFLVRLAVRTTVAGLNKIVSRLALVGYVKELERAIQVLAILMCPAPERHKAVVQYCIDPLGQPIISDEIRDRLLQSMPGWMTGRAEA
jgi:hypothetical protein